MKFLHFTPLLLLFLLLGNTSAHAQTGNPSRADTLSVEQYGPAVYLKKGDEYLPGGFMFRKWEREMAPHPQAAPEFRKFKKNTLSAWGFGVTSIALLVAGINTDTKPNSVTRYSLISGGLVLAVPALICTHRSHKHLKKAVYLYNQN